MPELQNAAHVSESPTQKHARNTSPVNATVTQQPANRKYNCAGNSASNAHQMKAATTGREQRRRNNPSVSSQQNTQTYARLHQQAERHEEQARNRGLAAAGAGINQQPAGVDSSERTARSNRHRQHAGRSPPSLRAVREARNGNKRKPTGRVWRGLEQTNTYVQKRIGNRRQCEVMSNPCPSPNQSAGCPPSSWE